MDVLDTLIEASRRSGDKRALRIMPWESIMFSADGDGTEHFAAFPMEPDTERILLFMDWGGWTDAAVPVSSDPFSANSLFPILRHNGIDLLEPEAVIPGFNLVSPSFHELAKTHTLTSGNQGAISGTIPLLQRVGPGGRLDLGIRKTAPAGFPPTWFFHGVCHYIKL